MIHLFRKYFKLRTSFRKLSVFVLVVCSVSFEPDIQAGGELRRPFQGVRNLGMGNVGVALSHDENALFYNPAGLAAVDTTIVSIPFVNEVSKDTLSLTSQVAKLGSDSTTADTVALALGKQIHYRNMTALNVIIPFGSLMTFGAAAGLETSIDLSASNPVGIQFNYGMRLDQIYNIGIAMTPFDGLLLRNFYEIDIRDLTFEHSDDTYCQKNKNSADCNMKRIHIGTEFGFWPIDSGASALALRLGWNQGYVSQGLEINPLIFFRGLSIQYADYKVETGNSAGDKPERRRTLQVNLGF